MTAWADELTAVGERIGQRFARSEPRRRAVGYVRGLLSGVERKNGWQMAEHLGDPTPDGVQHLLARADWDADAVRDDLLGYAAGRIENAQVGVFLGYATARGRALLDRPLYLPTDWAADADRREEAGVPGAVGFATKILLARRMVERAVAAGVPARWVTADAVYGSDYHFRTTVEGHGLGYVVGVRTDFAVWAGFRQVRVGTPLAGIPADAWHRLSCGDGAKGPRVYDWAVSRTNAPEPNEYARWVLIRRSVSDPTEVAHFACGGPPGTTLAELVRVAGARWAIEDLFERAKGDCGLDEYEVRSWAGWHRHITLGLFALAVVAVTRSRAAKSPPRKKGGRS